MRGSPLRVVMPGEDGKLRLGGGGGGDLDGFSVRYRGTVSSSGKGSNSGTLRNYDPAEYHTGWFLLQ